MNRLSTPPDRRSKDVRIPPVVITELEFGDIERHIFSVHFVERADYATLENRPKAFNGLSVNCADNILTARMINSRVWIVHVELIVARILIGAKQADPMRHGFADERGESIRTHVRDNARDHITLAADHPNDRRFAGANASSSAAAAALVPMPVFGQAANKSFIDFDNAAELVDVLHESGSDLVAHEPSGFIGTEAHIAHDLQCAHPLLAGEHQVDDAIPIAKRLIGVLENGIDQDREAVPRRTARGALRALPMPIARGQVIYSRIAATRAAYAVWPAASLQVHLAGVFVRKHRLKFRGGKLMNRPWLFAACHGVLPMMERRYHV